MEARNNINGKLFRLIVFKIRLATNIASFKVMLPVSFYNTIKKLLMQALFIIEQFILIISTFNIISLPSIIDKKITNLHDIFNIIKIEKTQIFNY